MSLPTRLPTFGMVASTTRSSTTCSQTCPATNCEKCSQSSNPSVELTQSLITRPACSNPTGKSCNTYIELVHRCAWKTEEAAPKKQLTAAVLRVEEADLAPPKANPVSYQTRS